MILRPTFRNSDEHKRSRPILNSAAGGQPGSESPSPAAASSLVFRGSDLWLQSDRPTNSAMNTNLNRTPGIRKVLAILMALLTFAVLQAQAVTLWTTNVPVSASFDTNDVAPYTFGVRFKSTVNGTVTGIRFYKGPLNTGVHLARLWTDAGTHLATRNFTNETASGWQQVNFVTPVSITNNTVYVASYTCPNGGYSADLAGDPGGLSAGYTNLPLIALPASDGGNGVLATSTNTFPNINNNGINWWVDVVFSPVADTNPPVVSSVIPTAGAVNVQPNASVQVTFNEAMLASTINTSTITLSNNSSGALVASTVNYTPGSPTATLQPNSPLTLGQTYTARVRGGASGVKDTSTNALVSTFSWSFTISSSANTSIWDPAITPPLAVDDSAVTLGVKFRSMAAGYIRGIRFYKGLDNTGTHVGTLWTSGGAKLAEATFTGETVSGWQEQLFASPIAIASNTTYVASYFAPNGNYAFTGAYFTTQGVTNSPLIALPEGADGGNGVFDAAALTNSFPTSSFNSANYWVDVVYVASLGPDTNAPTVIATSPVNAATGVSLTPVVTATFSEAMLASTINTNTFELRNAGNVLIPSTVSYNAGSQMATLLASSALAVNQTYTARVIGGGSGVKDAATNALASNYTWNFTTTANAATNIFGPGTPTGTLSVTETNPLTLGVKFRSAAAGFIRGIRFYKGTNNTGVHIGALWSSEGTQLASVTFSGETASGWQQQLFSSPVLITSNATYVASYFAPRGGYAFESFFFQGKGVTNFPLRALSDGEDGGNGVFNEASTNAFPTSSFNAANYSVDVIFTDQNTAPNAGTLNVTLPEDTSTNLTLIGTDPEGTVTFSLVSNPANGTLSNFNTNTGTITYRPATNYFGPDTFNYRVSDGSLFATGMVNLTVTGVNDPATADNKSISVAKDVATNLVLTATDPDGASSVSEVLVATAATTPDNWQTNGTTSKVTAVAANDGASTYINSGGTDNTQQQFLLSDPVFIQPGDPINSVTLRSVARRGGSGSSSFRTAAVLSGIGTNNSSSHSVGNSFEEFTDAFVTRPGGGAWTLPHVTNLQMRLENLSRDIDCTKFDALVSFQGNTNRSYTILAAPAHGSISGLNTNNGALTYTPTPGYVGPDSFTFRVNSGGLLTTGLVSITVIGTNANTSPVVLNPIGVQNATYGTAFSFTFPTNTFVDAETPVLAYNASGMPPGILFTNTTRTFAGTPSASGNYSVRVIATDTGAPPLAATNTFSLNVAKAALSVTSSNQSKPYGVPFSFTGREFFTAGLKLSDTATNATLSSAGAPANAVAGPYPISITNVIGIGLTNYTINFFTGTMTVAAPVPFSITSISVTNDLATITWQSISGRVYRLEYKNDLVTPTWTEVPVDVVSTGSSTSTTNNTSGTTNRFYRVK
jgi:hypothetical protein